MKKIKQSSSKSHLSNNIQNNIAFLMKKAGIDIASLARETGLTQSTLTNLRSRANNPTLLTLNPIAEFFNVTIDELIHSDIENSKSTKNTQNSAVNIPIISTNDIELWPSNSFPSDFIITGAGVSSECFAIKLNSEVLMPNYSPGTILICDPNRKPKDSDLVIVSEMSKRPTYRKIFFDAGTAYFKPINKDFGGLETIENYKIHAVVVRAIVDCSENRAL